jgi:hypothetical protein
MTGRIDQAREAAKLFVKSLPPNSYFSFVFFGSNYVAVPPGEGVKYTSETAQNAWDHLSKIDANMGGTELDGAMRYVLSRPRIKGYMRNILVMTDGEVSQPDVVIDLIKQNATDSYVTTIGIGAGASRHLVQGLAEAGRGTSYFITEDEVIMPKVIEALNNMCVDKVQNIKIHWPTKPQLSYEPRIGFYNQPLVATAIFEEEPSGRVTITGYRSDDGKYFESTFDLNSVEVKEGVDVYQLAVKQAFDKNLIKDTEEICRLSKKYSVLSGETAFVAKKIYADPADRRNVKEVKVPIMKTREHLRYRTNNFMYHAQPRSKGSDGLRNTRQMEFEIADDTIAFDVAEYTVDSGKGNELMELIGLQRVSGSFEFDKEIIKKHLDRLIEDIKSELPKGSVLSTNEEVFATVLILSILDKKYQNALEIELIRVKAIDWLKTKGVSYDSIKQELNNITNTKTDL